MRSLHLYPLIAAAVVLLPLRAVAEEKPNKPWKNAGEVSFLSTNGNSKATTTSIKNTFNYSWVRTALELIGGGLGAQTGGHVTAEQYNASEKLSYTLGESKRSYLFEKFGWDSNRFAGFRNRYDATAGLGRQLLLISSHTLIGELSGGYVNEERITVPRNDFASGRVYSKYIYAFNALSRFSQDVEYLHNFENYKDYRLNTETALIGTVTSHLLLKASFKWNRVGAPPPGIVKDDTTTGVALVINY